MSALVQGELIALPVQPRAQRRFMAHVADAGAEAARFACGRCGWDSDWIVARFTNTALRRGVPCPVCNKEPLHD